MSKWDQRKLTVSFPTIHRCKFVFLFRVDMVLPGHLLFCSEAGLL